MSEMNESLTDIICNLHDSTDWLTQWLSEMNDSLTKWLPEWLNESLNEWVKEVQPPLLVAHSTWECYRLLINSVLLSSFALCSSTIWPWAIRTIPIATRQPSQPQCNSNMFAIGARGSSLAQGNQCFIGPTAFLAIGSCITTSSLRKIKGKTWRRFTARIRRHSNCLQDEPECCSMSWASLSLPNPLGCGRAERCSAGSTRKTRVGSFIHSLIIHTFTHSFIHRQCSFIDDWFIESLNHWSDIPIHLLLLIHCSSATY